MAEIVYALTGVYGVGQSVVCAAFRKLTQSMSFYDLNMLFLAFDYYALTSLDFVDRLLVDEHVFSFDRHLMHHANA